MTTFREAVDRELLARETQGSHPRLSNWMSEIGHPCLRRLVWDRRHADEIPPHDVATLRRFEAGTATELALRRFLEHEVGCIIDRQVVLHLEPNLSGKLDGMIAPPGDRDGLAPYEVKALAPHCVERIHSIADFEKFPFYRGRYECQGQAYLAALNLDPKRRRDYPYMLWFVCPRGDHLAFREIVQEYSPTFADIIRARATMIEEHLGHGTTPDVDYDYDICGLCHWQPRCWPQMEAAPTDLPTLDDPELEMLLDRMEELKPVAAEYAELEDERKARVNERRLQGRCGHWKITGRLQKGAPIYEIPKDVKETYRTGQVEYWRAKFERIEEA